MRKVLIIRFSSIGDVIQCLWAADRIRGHWPDSEIHWLVRSDVRDAVSLSPSVQRIWSLDRGAGIAGLLSLAWKLRGEGFTHIYDAHESLRSRVIRTLLRAHLKPARLLTRSKQRLRRFLLLRLKINTFKPWPFRGAASYLKPLERWEIPFGEPSPAQAKSASGPVVIVPGSNWPKKNWPVKHWISLVRSLGSQKVEILGGKAEEPLAQQIIAGAKGAQIESFAGRQSLAQSLDRIAKASRVISGDTGLMHAADYLGVPTTAIIGPTAFGYPTRATSRIAELTLDCKPCSKDGSGGCRNSVYQRCLIELEPSQV